MHNTNVVSSPLPPPHDWIPPLERISKGASQSGVKSASFTSDMAFLIKKGWETQSTFIIKIYTTTLSAKLQSVSTSVNTTWNEKNNGKENINTDPEVQSLQQAFSFLREYQRHMRVKHFRYTRQLMEQVFSLAEKRNINWDTLETLFSLNISILKFWGKKLSRNPNKEPFILQPDWNKILQRMDGELSQIHTRPTSFWIDAFYLIKQGYESKSTIEKKFKLSNWNERLEVNETITHPLKRKIIDNEEANTEKKQKMNQVLQLQDDPEIQDLARDFSSFRESPYGFVKNNYKYPDYLIKKVLELNEKRNYSYKTLQTILSVDDSTLNRRCRELQSKESKNKNDSAIERLHGNSTLYVDASTSAKDNAANQTQQYSASSIIFPIPEASPSTETSTPLDDESEWETLISQIHDMLEGTESVEEDDFFEREKHDEWELH